jgi:hypothetical protein
MARHAAPTNDGSRTSFTIRLPPATGSWLYSHAQACNASLTQIVLGFLVDLRTWFGLREDVQALVVQDMECLKLSQRDYLRLLLLERIAEIKARGPGWEKDDLNVALAHREQLPP